MNIIDCHVLFRPGVDNPDWLSACLKSLEGEPVNVTIELGIEGDTAMARRRAYEKTNAPFVAYVDHDDVVVPGTFAACLDAMDDEAVGAYTWVRPMNEDGHPYAQPLNPHIEWSIDRQALTIPMLFSAGSIVRQSVMLTVLRDYFDIIPPVWGQDRCMFLLCAIAGPWRCVPQVGYMWRQHAKSTSRKRSERFANPAEALLDRVRPVYDVVERQIGRKLTLAAEAEAAPPVPAPQ